MKRALAASSLALVLASGAWAQAGQTSGLSARLGLFFPSNGSAQDAGKTWLAAGLDYRLSYLGVKSVADRNLGTFTSLSVDYYGKGDYSAVPILFNITGSQDSLYVSAGAGMAFQRVEDGSGTEANTRFTFQLSAGYDFVHQHLPYFVEARYWGSSSAQLSGFGFYGGIRF